VNEEREISSKPAANSHPSFSPIVITKRRWKSGLSMGLELIVLTCFRLAVEIKVRFRGGEPENVRQERDPSLHFEEDRGVGDGIEIQTMTQNPLCWFAPHALS